MSKRKKKMSMEEMKEAEANAKVRVRLDSRTVITLSDLAKLEFWKERYPNLQVLTS